MQRFFAVYCGILALAGLAGEASLSSLPSAAVPDGFGVNIHFTTPREGEMEMLESAGVRWVRMDFTWNRIEKTKGSYDFSAYERLLAALDSRKMRALFILDYGNSLYDPKGYVNTDEARQAFTHWAVVSMLHFKGRGIVWEIWNEPNGTFWKPKADVDEYIALALAVSKAFREAAPGETLIGPAVAGVDLKFLEKCFQAGLLEYWDAVSVHPYRQSSPETVAVNYSAMRSLIARYAPQKKKIDILSGEWGYSSIWRTFDPQRQGKFLARQWLINLASHIPLSIWYDWHDDGTDLREPEHHFGMVANEYHADRNPVYDPKPAYLAAKTLTSELSGFTYERRLAVGGPDEYALLFRNQERVCIALWSTSQKSAEITIPSSDCAFEAVSHTGEMRTPFFSRGGHFTFSATVAPQYLFARGANPLLDEAPAMPPLRITLTPVPGRKLIARFENLELEKYHCTARLDRVTGLEPLPGEKSIDFAPGELSKTVNFELKTDLPAQFSAEILIEAAGRTVRFPAREFKFVPGDVVKSCKVVADGNPQVASEQTLSVAIPPEPLSEAPALKFSYRFDEGWKFMRVVPKNGPVLIEGQPKAIGLWILGDGKRLAPRIRLADSSHQVFQFAGEEISWTGWRYVQFDLESADVYWGGRNDGTIHLPLSWDSLFLADNPSKHPLDGVIYISTPLLMY